jgi:hypothetical protein
MLHFRRWKTGVQQTVLRAMTRKTESMTTKMVGVAEEMKLARIIIIYIRKAGNMRMTVNVVTDRKEKGMIRVSMRELGVATRQVVRLTEQNTTKVAQGVATVRD